VMGFNLLDLIYFSIVFLPNFDFLAKYNFQVVNHHSILPDMAISRIDFYQLIKVFNKFEFTMVFIELN